MTEDLPRLVAVPSDPEAPASSGPGAQPQAADDRRRGVPWPWLLGAGLAACALGWAFEAQESRQLATSLQASNAALAEVRAELRAYDAHLGDVRERVGALSEQLQELEDLISAGPARPPATR